MIIYGSYYNHLNQKVSVSINCRTSDGSNMEIGTDKSGIYFTDDPIEITSQVNDSFDHLLCYQASVRLLCKDYVPAFFCDSCFSAAVNIYVDDHVVFAGFVKPQTFSQSFNEELDEVELTCIDCLCALQYYNYKFIGSEAVSYAIVKANAKQRTLGGILQEMLRAVSNDGDPFPVYYDGSKAIDDDTAHRYTIFDDISVSELLFLDDEESSVWTMEDVLTEILKYLNLHIMQMGKAFYIFSWESIRSSSTVSFKGIIDAGLTINRDKIQNNISNDIAANCDTQISISGTYNQFILTDSVKEIENVVESPLEDKSLSTAGNYQKFMTELISEGEGKKAYNGIKDMCLNGTAGYDGASTVDWFVWPKKVSDWRFYGCGNRSDIYSKYPVDGTNQQAILTEGMTSGIGACVCAFGKIEHKNAKGDNSPVTSVSMENYLVVSTMGNTGKPTADQILSACPVAEYTGSKSGGTFSPADDSTVNYIVISGKMVLNPVMEATGIYSDMSKADSWIGFGLLDKFVGRTVPSRNNSDGRYYTRKYWKAAKWNEEVTLDDATNAKDAHSTFYPFTGTGPQDYEFNYSAVGKQEDTIKKVGLLACMLVIGDKCVVEKQKGEDLGTGVVGTGEGEPQDYVWMDYKERSQCSSDDEYYQQSFTIGIDPKLGDKILGTEFDIQKNAPYTLGITAEGTAIPIKMSDKVSGQVHFKILGPVNAEWNNITRRHPSFWRHTKWSSEGVSLLEKTNAILMKDFKVEVMSDNGKVGAVSDESDIVYMSDTMEGFVNKKDDLEFKITTALTSAECKSLGVNNAVKLSSPQNVVTGNALLTIYDRTSGTVAKPEQLYVDAYYQEWHTPRVEMTQSFVGNASVDLFQQFFHPAINKRFYVQGFDYNPTGCISTAVMKEVF